MAARNAQQPTKSARVQFRSVVIELDAGVKAAHGESTDDERWRVGVKWHIIAFWRQNNLCTRKDLLVRIVHPCHRGEPWVLRIQSRVHLKRRRVPKSDASIGARGCVQVATFAALFDVRDRVDGVLVDKAYCI